MIFKYLFAGTTLLLTAISSAADLPSDSVEEVTISTAARVEQNVFDVAAAVSVLSAEDIKKLQMTDIADALDLIPTADIVRTGGSYGAQTSLFTRGTASNQTLILINGQRFSSATLGTSAFQLIDPTLVKRVEYVRGSRSSLYGSEALGGVLQIFTSEADGKNSGRITSEFGSFETFKQSASGNLNLGKLDLSGGLSYVESDGIDATIDESGENGDNDSFENISVNLFGSYQFDNEAEIKLSYLESQSEADYDNQFNSSARPFREQTISAFQASAYLPLSESFSTELSLGTSADESDELDRIATGASNTFFYTNRDSLYWQNKISFGENTTLIAGLDAYTESVDSIPGFNFFDGTPLSYAEDERDNAAIFAQLQTNVDKAHIVLGARHDDNSQFNTHQTYSASINVHVDEYTRAFASWSEGFKAPTFNDLYWPVGGNPNLEPEQSANSELGLKGQNKSFAWEIIAFHSDIDNLIQWLPNEDGVFMPQNIAEVEIRGFESNIRRSFGNLNLELSASYTSPKDKVSGEDLGFRVKRKLAFKLIHEFDKWNYGALIRAYGPRRETGFSVAEFEAYELLDLFVNYEVIESLNLSLKVINASDESYTQRSGFNTEERNFKAAATFTF